MPEIHYLAYGSNLHPLRLAERVPSARGLGVVRLPGWTLAFHKRSIDGSGKCLFYETGDAAAVVHGVLYAFDAREKPRLDAAEGAGEGYEARVVEVSFGGARFSPFVYTARASHIDASLRPYPWYRALVVAGALHHGFPRDYVAALRTVPSRPDPDRERARRHEALLARMRALT